MLEKVIRLAKFSLPILSLYALHNTKSYASTGSVPDTKITEAQRIHRASQLFRDTSFKLAASSGSEVKARKAEKVANINTVHDLVNYLGFVTPEQKHALELVFRRFGASEEEIAYTFNRELHTQEDIFDALLNLAQMSQEYLARRKGERWETAPKDGIEEGDLQLLAAAECLNLFSEVKPSFDHPDAICILGARKAFMDQRMQYAAQLLQNGNSTKYLILAGGERKATAKPEIDGSPTYIADLAEEFGVAAEEVTEMHLMRKAYLEQMETYTKLGEPEVVEFNAKGRSGYRPTTENNIIELCNWVNDHPEVHTLYIVSNQFYVEYQAAIIKTVLAQQGININVAVIGPKYDFSKNPTIKIHNILGELGTQIWAKILNLTLELGLHTKDENKLDHFAKLYAGMPICREFVEQQLRADAAIHVAKSLNRPGY